MERKIAECSTYKELAQELIRIIKFNANECRSSQDAERFVDDTVDLCDDAQQRIDSYELDPETDVDLDDD